MLVKISQIITVLTLCSLLTSCNNQSTEIENKQVPLTPVVNNSKAIVLGDVSNNPAKKIRRFQPMATYLANKLTDFEIQVGDVKIAQDLDTISNWLKAGEVDIYFDSLYPALLVQESSGAKPILRRWKKGKGEYHTVFFALKKSNIRKITDLQGKNIAFDDPRSTSGYLLPLAYLIKAGLKPIEQRRVEPNRKNNQIAYTFSEDDENTIQWVISGKVQAGAVDNQTFFDIPTETRAAMQIIAETESVPRQLVLVRGDLNPQMAEKIKQVLLKMDQDAEGKEVLKAFEKTTKFDEITAQQSLQKMEELYNLVKNR